MTIDTHVLLQVVARARDLSAALEKDGPSGSWQREKARLDSALCQLPHEVISSAVLAETFQPAEPRIPDGCAS